jgi:hypothetical protein
VVLGAVLRAVAEAGGRRVVPEGARVVGQAVEGLAADAGVFQADADELRQVLGKQPGRQAARVERPLGQVADAALARIEAHDMVGGGEDDAPPA